MVSELCQSKGWRPLAAQPAVLTAASTPPAGGLTLAGPVLIAAGLALPLVASPRTLTDLGAVAETPAFVGTVASGLQILGSLIAFGCGMIHARRADAGSRTLATFLVLLGLCTLVGTLLAAVAVGSYLVLWPLAVAGLAMSLGGSVGLERPFVWIARSVTVGSVLSLTVPSYSLMSVSDSGRSLFGLGRLTGIMPHPNSLGVFAILAILVELMAGGRGWWKVIGLAAGSVCVILSQSSNCYICLALVALWAAFVHVGGYRPLVLAGVICALGCLSVSGGFSRIFADLDSDRLDTVSGREIIWQYSWQSITAHPFFGIGQEFLSDNFRKTFLPASEQQAVHAHNQLIQTLGEAGFVGATLLVLMILYAFSRAITSYQQNDKQYELLFLIVFLLVSTTEVPLRQYGASGLTALLSIFLLQRVVTHRRKVLSDEKTMKGLGTFAGPAVYRGKFGLTP